VPLVVVVGPLLVEGLPPAPSPSEEPSPSLPPHAPIHAKLSAAAQNQKEP
jgi:hypothetical protein